MSTNPHVVIIGAGPVGLTAAAHLAQRQIPFTVLEAGLPAVAVIVLALSDGGWTAWIAVGLLGASQGTATLLRPMLLSRLHGPDGYGRLAATSAATTTVARATAPLALAALAATVGYGVGLHPVRSRQRRRRLLAARALAPTLEPVDTDYSLTSS